MKNFIEISQETGITLININHIIYVDQHVKNKNPFIRIAMGSKTVSVQCRNKTYEELLEMIQKAAE